MKRYGYIPDLGHTFDRRFSLRRPGVVALPPLVDLRLDWPDINDQGDSNSCVGNAVQEVMTYACMNEGLDNPPIASRLFIYYVARDIEGSTAADCGCQIRDAIAGANRYGVCPETEWPFDVGQVLTRPPAQCYADAPGEEIIISERLDDGDGVSQLLKMKQCLAEGWPVVLGMTVYESFESDDVRISGVVPMPQPGEGIMGGHAICLVGYLDDQKVGILANSWGTSWGKSGFFTLPYGFLDNSELVTDCWKVASVGSVAPSGRPVQLNP